MERKAYSIRLSSLLSYRPAAIERSFSALRQVTMSLNSLMVLHIHEDLTDSISFKSVAEDFVSKSDCCESKFSVNRKKLLCMWFFLSEIAV